MGQRIATGSMIAVLAAVIGIDGAGAAEAARGESPAAPIAVQGSSVTMSDVQSRRSYRFTTNAPIGGRLTAVEGPTAAGETTSAVLVEDASGAVIGAYDAAWAQDATGREVPSAYRIDGVALVQTVRADAATLFPVHLELIYSPMGGQFTLLAAAAKVTVPSNYVYDPALGTLHDYCTDAPDEFPNLLGANADFRGPCARHDLCYASGKNQLACDNALHADMYTNCEYYYAWYNPARQACYRAADLYWAAVVID